jgi:hypothetical protein
MLRLLRGYEFRASAVPSAVSSSVFRVPRFEFRFQIGFEVLGLSNIKFAVSASFRTLARRANRPAVLRLVRKAVNWVEATSVAFSNCNNEDR